MAERCARLPRPVVRRLALGRLGFHYDRHAGADDVVLTRRQASIFGIIALSREEDCYEPYPEANPAHRQARRTP
jgi:hypothetical protein